jgi:ATP-binding protein involved in chromosome partitioning
MAADFDLTVLGEIPLEMSIREQADAGIPTVAATPDSQTAKKYRDIALRVAAKLSDRKRNFTASFPPIVVEST